MDSAKLESDVGTPRVIKRYSNRKLYDTGQSRYVTLLEVAEMIRAGEDVCVVDNDTKADKTDVTLALIISEELKTKPRAIPIATLRALIRHRGGRLLTGLRDGPIARFIPSEGHAADSTPPGESPTMAGSQETSEKDAPRGLLGALEHWQHLIDDRIRAVLRNYSAIGELQQRIEELTQRVAKLEQTPHTEPAQSEPGVQEPRRE